MARRKSWYQSRSIWLGVLTCIGSVLSFAQGHDLIVKNPTAVSVIGLIVGSLIIICRYLSVGPMNLR